jgi:hypothetical protein
MEVFRKTKQTVAKTLRGRKGGDTREAIMAANFDAEEEMSDGIIVPPELMMLPKAGEVDIPLQYANEEVTNVFPGVSWAYDLHVPDALRTVRQGGAFCSHHESAHLTLRRALCTPPTHALASSLRVEALACRFR